jgi:hypothetical protein
MNLNLHYFEYSEKYSSFLYAFYISIYIVVDECLFIGALLNSRLGKTNLNAL